MVHSAAVQPSACNRKSWRCIGYISLTCLRHLPHHAKWQSFGPLIGHFTCADCNLIRVPHARQALLQTTVVSRVLPAAMPSCAAGDCAWHKTKVLATESVSANQFGSRQTFFPGPSSCKRRQSYLRPQPEGGSQPSFANTLGSWRSVSSSRGCSQLLASVQALSAALYLASESNPM